MDTVLIIERRRIPGTENEGGIEFRKTKKLLEQLLRPKCVKHN